jgi:hypothetical protein
MSRGPGRIERAILLSIQKAKVDFDGKPRPSLLTSWRLAFRCYPELGSGFPLTPPHLAQRTAIARALHSIVRKHPEYALAGGRGRKHLCLYEPADPLSVLCAKLTVERGLFVTLSEVRHQAAS